MKWEQSLWRRFRLRPATVVMQDQAAFYREYPPRLALNIVDPRIVISHKWKYAYARIPKAANSTIVATLHAAETGCSEISDIDRTKREFINPSQLDPDQLNELESSYFKFTFVRNPYTRLLSAYLDKILAEQRTGGRHRRKAAAFLGRPVEADISFSDFVDYLEFGGGVHTNGHWARQIDMLVMPPGKFDYVGKFEDLEQGLGEATRRIFGARKEINTYAPHATSASSQIALLDGSLRRRIARIYEEDFEAFHYPFDS
jgi:dermatan 4-sulfotransferase 1